MTPGSRSMTGREWSMLVLLSVLWGGSFFFQGVAVKELPPMTVVLLRVALAAVGLQIIARARGAAVPLDRARGPVFVVMAMLNIVIPFSLIVWGQTQIPSGVASILNATTPLFTVVVAHVLTRDEKLTAAKVAGVALGFLGVLVLIGPSAFGRSEAGVLAHLAGVAAALSYSLAGIYGRRVGATGVSPLSAAAATTTAATIILTPVVLVVDGADAILRAGPWTWAAIVGVSQLSTTAGYLLYYRILATAGATNLMLVTFLMPVSSILLGVAVLGETLSAAHFAGLALIACGLAAIDGRALRRARAGSA